MALHRAGRQTVGDDQRDVIVTGMRRERRLRLRGQLPAEIGTHQIVAAPADRTVDHAAPAGRARTGRHGACPHRAARAPRRARAHAPAGSRAAARSRSRHRVRASPIRAAVSARSSCQIAAGIDSFGAMLVAHARQQCAEAARQASRPDAIGASIRPCRCQPGLEFRRGPLAEQIAHRQRVMERRALVAEHDVVGARHAHHEGDARGRQQRQQRVGIVLIGLGVIGVADVDAHRQAEQLAAEMILQARRG